ncbi:MAG: NTP transferase domain-containing protein [Eubacteriales bacterium]|nr:NTP transferase domain-containing protein [Eubacteriales bacterium]
MKIGAVVTAAGMSSRMGEFKPMLLLGAISAAQRVVSTLRQAGAEPVVVITGNQAESLEHHLAKSGAIFLRNEAYAQTDMFASARLGLAYLADKCDHVLFTPVDVPLYTADTVKRLLEAEGDMIVPVCRGTSGHPVVFSAAAIQQLLAYTGSEGLRGAVKEAAITPVYVEVEDAGTLYDMDTPTDYAQMLAYHNSQLLRPVLDVRLSREADFFDAGTARFLALIEETHSVRTACERMSISYSKAWMLLDDIERNYGAPAVLRKRGGKAGGASALTEEGQKLLARYTAFEAACKAAAEGLFEEYFGDRSL